MSDIRAVGFQQRQYVKKIVIASAATHRQFVTVIIGADHTWQRSQLFQRLPCAGLIVSTAQVIGFHVDTFAGVNHRLQLVGSA